MTAVDSNAGRPTFYAVKEVAEILKMSRMTVYRAIEDGELRAVRVRGRWLVPGVVIEELATGAAVVAPGGAA